MIAGSGSVIVSVEHFTPAVHSSHDARLPVAADVRRRTRLIAPASSQDSQDGPDDPELRGVRELRLFVERCGMEWRIEGNR